MDIGYNATTDALSGMLHKIGALTLCDPVYPRARGITLSQVSSGRDDGVSGPSSAARMGFMRVNDTASLKAENGAMASMVPGAVHIARAWVRCARGSSTVALVVSKLPRDAPVVAQDIPVSMMHHDAMTNLSVAGESTSNTHRCDVDTSAYTSRSDAPESASGWVQLEVAVSSTEAEHDITMQVIVHSHSSDAAVVIDDASWEVETGTSPTPGSGSDDSNAEWVFLTTCAGGGGGGVSYTDAHKCSSDPTRLFYRLREMGGVPVAHETVHAMVLIGYQSVRCRRPELDVVSQAECPFLSEASLPHLSADDVRAYMDTLSDNELASAMRWDDERVRGPGVRSNLAVEILRAGLPEAIELGVVRVVDGPNYNLHLSSASNPNIGTSPTAGIVWHAMSSTSEMKVFDDRTHAWRQCSHHEDLRHVLCYFWGEIQFSLGCSMVSSLLDVADWEEYITHEGWMGTLEVVNNHYDTFLEPLVKHFADVNVAGQALCYRSLLAVYEDLARAPESLALEDLDADCAAPLTRSETRALLSLVLPMTPPDGMTCVDLSAVDFMTTNPFRHHAHLHASDGAAGDETLLAVAVSIGAVCVLAFGLAVARMRRGCDAGKPAERDESMAFSSLDAISPSTLTSCARSSTLLGKGAEAEVFLATVTFPGGETKRIATKMFYKASTAKAEISFYERLPRHDNILSVHGCYFDNNAQRWCVAMEYLRHGNVRESMITKAFPRHGPFMHRSLSGLMDALGALHANGMAHRDLKLDNVLLSCECAPEADCACLRTYSPSVRAKLSDFAMARQGTLMGVSSANLKGTMMYVPPERVEYDPANHQADFYCRGDVYALGLMTWEMLHFLHSGEVVSCAEAILPGVRNPQDVLIEISKGKFVPPCEFLPEPVQRYLRKCWHFKPAKRFKDAREARRVWEKIRADVHAVADKSQILQSSIGSSSKGTDAALLGSTASTNRDLTGVTTTTASPVRSSV
jgi:serine/threonine protein kinase